MERIVVCFVLILRSFISIFLSLGKMTPLLSRCVLSSVCPQSRLPSLLSFFPLFLPLPFTPFLPLPVTLLLLWLTQHLVIASLGSAASRMAYMTGKADTWRQLDEMYRSCQRAASYWTASMTDWTAAFFWPPTWDWQDVNHIPHLIREISCLNCRQQIIFSDLCHVCLCVLQT